MLPSPLMQFPAALAGIALAALLVFAAPVHAAKHVVALDFRLVGCNRCDPGPLTVGLIDFALDGSGDLAARPTVRVWVNGRVVGSLAFVRGNVTIASLTAGVNTVYADVADDADWVGTASAPITVTLDRGKLEIGESGDPFYPAFRQDFTRSVCVTYPNAYPALGEVPRPTGTASLWLGEVLRTAPLTRLYSAHTTCADIAFDGETFARTTTPVATAYAGDANWQPIARSSWLPIVPGPNVTASTSRSVDRPVVGQPVDFTFKVSPLPGVKGVPDGEVVVWFGAAPIRLPLDRNGEAHARTSFHTPAPLAAIAWMYPGTAQWSARGDSSAPINYVLPLDPASIRLELVPTGTIYAGRPTRLWARASPIAPSTDPVPGAVVFARGTSYPDLQFLCRAPLVDGVAGCDVTFPTPGELAVSVTAGDCIGLHQAYSCAELASTIRVAALPPPAPRLAVEPTSLDFGAVAVRTQSAWRRVVVTNAGDAAAALTTRIAGDFVQVSRCAPTLDARRTCDIDVAFRPSSADPISGTLEILTNGEIAARVTLSGSGSMDEAPASIVSDVEYYHAALDHYFLTIDAAEIALLDTGVLQGWRRTGQSIPVFAAGSKGASSPVCRYYGRPERGLDSHFFSADPAECIAVGDRFAADWVLETSEAFRVGLPDSEGNCAPGTTPVYRLFNGRSDANHRYTRDIATRDAMVARGFVLEGNLPGLAVMCAPGV